jgi:hypothetical protein
VDVTTWLRQEGVPDVVRGGDAWQAGPVKIAWKQGKNGAPTAKIAVGDAQYVLVARRKGVTLHPARRGRPDRKKTLATTAVEGPLREWLSGEEGRVALAMWAIWAGKLLAES